MYLNCWQQSSGDESEGDKELKINKQTTINLYNTLLFPVRVLTTEKLLNGIAIA
jgi:hypothetical protein